MARSLQRWKLARETVYLIAATIVFFALYFLFLGHQNRRAAAFLQNQRTEHPNEYLNEVRKLDGFMAYMAEFARQNHLDTPKLNAPIFIIGSWTLRDHPERIPVGSKPDCINPVIFEYGHFKVPQRNLDLAVLFSIEGNKLVIHPEAGTAFPVTLVAYAASIDHLELKVPGSTHVSYAYRCVE